MQLPSKVALVTGAGSGIGRATALELARQGARLIICDISAERLAAVSAELGSSLLLSRAVDVSRRDAMAELAESVHALVPAVDILVNNAGVGHGGNFLDTSLDDFEWVLGVNLRGVIHGCHFFAPKMVARGAGGHIINISSVLGFSTAPRLTAYVASKFAVLGFSQSLRAELEEHGIGVTAICPGLIATAIAQDSRHTPAESKHRERIVAAFRRGSSPDTVARAIVAAVAKNPAMLPVAPDGWALWALTRFAPSVRDRLVRAIRDRTAT